MKRCYVLGGRDSFLFRFADTAFGSKWSGFWIPQKKALDYYSYNIDGEWLGPHNCTGFRRMAGRARHEFDVTGLKVQEDVCVPPEGRGMVSVLKIRNWARSKKRLLISMKPGINMRHIWENAHERKYLTKGRSIVRTKSDIMEFIVYTKGGRFESEPEYRTHVPGRYIRDWGWKDEVEQSVYEPGLLTREVEVPGRKTVNVPFVFAHADDFRSLKRWERTMDSAIDAENESMKLYSLEDAGKAVCSFNALRTGDYYMAGLPWFQDCWGRDSAWMAMGALNLGDFEGVRKMLVELASRESGGRIPNRFNSGIEYGSADAPPLFIIALERYIRYSKDSSLFKELRPAVERILERGVGLMHNNLISREGRTWMDTLDRGEHCIELQALWAEAFLRASHFFKPRYERYHDQLVHSINNVFWKDGLFLDELHMDRVTSNVLFPLFFKQIEYKKALEAFHLLESDKFTTPVGIRTLSNQDIDYHPRGYHTGCVWGLLTGMMAYAEYTYGRDVVGKRYLDIILNNLSKRCEWSLDEVYDGDSFEPMGCVLQGWSLSPLFMVLDEMVLGIKPDLEHYVLVKPTDGLSRRSIRLGEDEFSIVRRGKNHIVEGLKQNDLKKGRATVKLG